MAATIPKSTVMPDSQPEAVDADFGSTLSPIQVDIEVLPKQMAFIKARSREVLYSGAFGAGKTRAICLKAAMRASRPGWREAMCRKHLVTFKATTLRTLLEPDGELPPVLPVGSYEHNKSEKVIKIKGGGEIIYFGLDDPGKVGSHNLSGVAIDEAVELVEPDWTALRGRIRMKGRSILRQIYGACNPGTPSHFLAERFGLAMGWKPKLNCTAITTRSTDNWYLPQDYIDNLNTFTGLAKARFVDGKWVGSEGLIYDKWDRQAFVMKREEARWARVVIGQDEGYVNPAVKLLILQDNDGRVHVAAEWYKTQQLESAVIKNAVRWNRRYKPEIFRVDSSAKKLIEGMRAHRLPVHGAPSAPGDVFDGIQFVQTYLKIGGDGRPRFTVDPSCENLIREFETYEWRKRIKTGDDYKDQPLKVNDHAMDALRYGMWEFHRPGSTLRQSEGSARIRESAAMSTGFSEMNPSSHDVDESVEDKNGHDHEDNAHLSTSFGGLQ